MFSGQRGSFSLTYFVDVTNDITNYKLNSQQRKLKYTDK